MMTEAHDIAIDVSHYQGKINWSVVASAGIKVAMIKATQGIHFKDQTFSFNKNEASMNGIKVIPYHFMDDSDTQKQADYFIRYAGLKEWEPYSLDWEGRASQTCDAQEATQVGLLLESRLKRQALWYFGMKGSTPYVPSNYMLQGARWIPRYPYVDTRYFAEFPNTIKSNPKAIWPGAHFAQYTQWGRVDGVNGNCDRSVWLGTLAQLDSWLKNGTLPNGNGHIERPVLSKGDKGPDVVYLQERLNDQDLSVIRVDGDFGKITEDLVKAVQAGNGLVIDGVVGPQTWGVLEEED